jgi:hypothetical protein
MVVEPRGRAGHAFQAAMAIYQHATLDRDKSLAEKDGATYTLGARADRTYAEGIRSPEPDESFHPVWACQGGAAHRPDRRR